MSLGSRIRNSHFLQSVAVLGIGTVLAQAIMVISAPILTRLYSPADFGLAALFAAIVGSVTPAICGKYEVAAVVAKSNHQSRQLLAIGLLVTLGVSVFAFVAVWFYGDSLARLFGFERLGNWILLVPFALAFTGILTALNYYANRLREYRIISQSKVIISVLGVAVSVVLGLFGLYFGLLLSSVLGTALVSLWLLYRYRDVLESSVLRNIRRKRVLAWRYRDFPVYSASTGLLDGVTQALPVFFLARYFPDSIVGYYALMLRVAMAPVSFVSSAVSQVNLKKVADLVNQQQPVRPYLLKVTLLLAAIVLPLMLLLILFAPPLFGWAFGEEWRVAGIYLQILMPALALQFVVSTVSTTFGATGNNRLGAIWKVTAFVVTFGMFAIVAPQVDIAGMFVAILITNLSLYGFYYLLAWRAAGHPMDCR